MIEELPDDIEQDELDDIEPVGDENQLYEHFRVVVDKGQAMVRVDKYLFERIVNASRNRIQKPIWASNSLIKLLNADTAHWYGALSIRMKVPS